MNIEVLCLTIVIDIVEFNLHLGFVKPEVVGTAMINFRSVPLDMLPEYNDPGLLLISQDMAAEDARSILDICTRWTANVLLVVIIATAATVVVIIIIAVTATAASILILILISPGLYLLIRSSRSSCTRLSYTRWWSRILISFIPPPGMLNDFRVG